MLSGRLDRPYSFRVIAKQGDVQRIIETVTQTTYKGRPAILNRIKTNLQNHLANLK